MYHTADMIQAIHVMYRMGKVDKNLSHPARSVKPHDDISYTEAPRFALLFAALICHMRHPGLTNDFMVKARTPEVAVSDA